MAGWHGAGTLGVNGLEQSVILPHLPTSWEKDVSIRVLGDL